SQIKSATETTVQKLASSLDQQWKAVMDQAFEETPPAYAMNLSASPTGPGGTLQPDIRRARVIHIKTKLRQEFPINFTQATTTISFVSGGGSLPPKAAYQQALS